MTATQSPTTDASGRMEFTSTQPATGEVVGVHPVDGEAEVRAAVVRARAASAGWAALDFDGRAPLLDEWRSLIAKRASDLVELVHLETGKPRSDAWLEVMLTLDHLAWATKHARKVLGRQKVSPGMLMANHSATIEYLPLGVIGVIGPWNYPVFTPMGSIAYALAAGNTVVFKPSEHTPGVGAWLGCTAAEATGRPGVLEVVTGFGATGHALVTAEVDKVAFTGSAATGRKVMAAAAARLTPVVMECGGKDAVIVDADADVEAAADAAVWGAMANAGQTCTGVERVYAHADVYDDLVERVADKARAIRPGIDPEADIGPMTMPSQLDVVRRHIDDALARGGRAVVGGGDAVGDAYVQPTVLVDVPEDSTAVTEETFGPTITIARVDSIDDAIDRANATGYGLGATVFSAARGEELARRLRTGMVSINSVISFAAIPSLPFGGVGESGFGRIHGADGLREMTRPQAVARQRLKPPMALTSFRRTRATDAMLRRIVRRLHGS